MSSENGALRNLNPLHGTRFTQTSLEIRDMLKEYVNSEEGSVPWQIAYVRRTSHYAVINGVFKNKCIFYKNGLKPL